MEAWLPYDARERLLCSCCCIGLLVSLLCSCCIILRSAAAEGLQPGRGGVRRVVGFVRRAGGGARGARAAARGQELAGARQEHCPRVAAPPHAAAQESGAVLQVEGAKNAPGAAPSAEWLRTRAGTRARGGGGGAGGGKPP